MASGVAATPQRSAADAALGISVVVATFRRLEQLAACLDGIESQTWRADEVLVVTHADPESGRYVTERAQDWHGLRLIEAQRARSVAAYNAGLRAVTTPLVAYIDDDAVPAPDWLGRIVATFRQDERIAAVGGRDVIVVGGRPQGLGPRRRRPPQVGRIQWSGRMTANHHIGTGPPRDVDVLKGVNMSFRTSAVTRHGFDDRLRGPGAVVHAELSICLPLRRQGLRIVYDPAIVVIHQPAPRPAGDHRHALSTESAVNSAHNEALPILEYVNPGRRFVFAGWSLLVGNTESPGIAVLARDVVTGRPRALARFLAAQRGRAAAWRTRRLRRANCEEQPDRDGAVAPA
jgi:cellulose synthase/poly-beta-1,6-N-acetylglucosamine synthase-like glycosyltransferase